MGNYSYRACRAAASSIWAAIHFASCRLVIKRAAEGAGKRIHLEGGGPVSTLTQDPVEPLAHDAEPGDQKGEGDDPGQGRVRAREDESHKSPTDGREEPPNRSVPTAPVESSWAPRSEVIRASRHASRTSQGRSSSERYGGADGCSVGVETLCSFKLARADWAMA
jgi:hypothetical protein